MIPFSKWKRVTFFLLVTLQVCVLPGATKSEVREDIMTQEWTELNDFFFILESWKFFYLMKLVQFAA